MSISTLEPPALAEHFGGDIPITLLWGSGGRAGSVLPRRFPTPEERLLGDISRGGFPLMRQDPCAGMKTILITGARGRHRQGPTKFQGRRPAAR
jgi:hypothetical protein